MTPLDSKRWWNLWNTISHTVSVRTALGHHVPTSPTLSQQMVAIRCWPNVAFGSVKGVLWAPGCQGSVCPCRASDRRKGSGCGAEVDRAILTGSQACLGNCLKEIEALYQTPLFTSRIPTRTDKQVGAREYMRIRMVIILFFSFKTGIVKVLLLENSHWSRQRKEARPRGEG